MYRSAEQFFMSGGEAFGYFAIGAVVALITAKVSPGDADPTTMVGAVFFWPLFMLVLPFVIIEHLKKPPDE